MKGSGNSVIWGTILSHVWVAAMRFRSVICFIYHLQVITTINMLLLFTQCTLSPHKSVHSVRTSPHSSISLDLPLQIKPSIPTICLHWLTSQLSLSWNLQITCLGLPLWPSRGCLAPWTDFLGIPVSPINFHTDTWKTQFAPLSHNHRIYRGIAQQCAN
jgi:hypothetical protein